MRYVIQRPGPVRTLVPAPLPRCDLVESGTSLANLQPHWSRLQVLACISHPSVRRKVVHYPAVGPVSVDSRVSRRSPLDLFPDSRIEPDSSWDLYPEQRKGILTPDTISDMIPPSVT